MVIYAWGKFTLRCKLKIAENRPVIHRENTQRFSSELPDHCYISRQALHCVHTSPAMVHHSADSSWHSPQNSPLISTIYKRKKKQIVSVNNSTITWVLWEHIDLWSLWPWPLNDIRMWPLPFNKPNIKYL